MSLLANAGSFTITSAGGTGNKTYAHGLASTPKVALFWTTYPGDSARGTNDHSISFGVAISSTSRRAAWMGAQRALDPSQADSRVRDDRCLMIYNGATPTLISDADFVSFDATNITLNITTAPTSDTTVFFLVLGGTDITDVGLVTFTQPGSPGTFDITTVGFQGNFLLLFSTNATALNTNTAHAAFNLGFTNGTNAALTSTLEEGAAASSDTRRYTRSAVGQLEILARLSETTNVAIQRNSFVSFLSNGFRLNAIETTASATQIFALVIKGGRWNVGDFVEQTVIGNFGETGAGFQPKALFAAASGGSTAQSTVDVPESEAAQCFGAATSSTARGAAWTGSDDAVTNNTEKQNQQSTTRLLITYDAFSAPPSVLSEIDFVSFDADGFTLNQTDPAGSNQFRIYFVCGDGAAGKPWFHYARQRAA